MASVGFIIQSRSDFATIHVQVSIAKGRVFKRSSHFVVNPKDWNFKKGLPFTRDVNLKQLDLDLQSLKVHLLNAINNSVRRDEMIDGNWLANQIEFYKHGGAENDAEYLISYTHNFIEKKIKEKQSGSRSIAANTIKGYKTFLSLLSRYEKSEGIKARIVDVNSDYVLGLREWMGNHNYAINYQGKIIDHLKLVCNDASKNGVPTNSFLPFIKGFSESKKREDILYLSFDELEKIRSCDLKKEHLINARSWLLLGCNIGQRVGDLLELSDENIESIDKRKVIRLIQTKTKKEVFIPLFPETLELLEGGFPKKISQQKFNVYIKQICKEAGLIEPVYGRKKKVGLGVNKYSPRIYGRYPKYSLMSSHVCRRSFASNYYGKIGTPLLIEITGHGSEKMFLKYIGQSRKIAALAALDEWEDYKGKNAIEKSKTNSNDGDSKLSIV